MSKKKARSQEVNETVVSETTVAEAAIEVTPTSTEASPTETPSDDKAKKPKRNARPYLDFATDALTKGLYTRKEFVTAILAAFPETKKGAVETFVTDLKNPKYNYFKPRPVVVTAEGKLIFEDVVSATEAGQVETEPVEAVGEIQAAETNESPIYHTTM